VGFVRRPARTALQRDHAGAALLAVQGVRRVARTTGGTLAARRGLVLGLLLVALPRRGAARALPFVEERLADKALGASDERREILVELAQHFLRAMPIRAVEPLEVGVR